MPTASSLDATKLVDTADGCLDLFCGGGSGGQRRKRFKINDKSLANDGGMLAAELNKLSVQEREMISEEVHGIIDLPNETPELINDSIEQLKVELQNVPRSKRRAYQMTYCLDAATVLRICGKSTVGHSGRLASRQVPAGYGTI
jgi:hypothetical protein